MTRTPATYASFPSTGFHFPDFRRFHVYPKRRVQPEAYLGRLQNPAGDRPLAMAKIGLDSRLISCQRCNSLGVHLMPEWCLVVAGLILLVTRRTRCWPRLRYTVIFRGVASLAPLIYAANTVTSTGFPHDGLAYRVVTLGLHELQACARAQALLACALQMLEAKEI